MTQQVTFLEEVLGDIGEVETLEQGLVLFQTVGMPARNLSARTREEYTNDLTDLIAFLVKRGKTKLTEIWLSDLEAYQAEMDRRRYESTTRKRKTYAIKTWFTYLHHSGVMIRTVAERLISPPSARRQPRLLSQDEYQRRLPACSHNARDRALIDVLLQTGMRLSKLARLTINDIELSRRIIRDPDNISTVRVLRKGRNIDMILLYYKACQVIASYLKVRLQVDHNSLFVTKFQLPMPKRAIQHRDLFLEHTRGSASDAARLRRRSARGAEQVCAGQYQLGTGQVASRRPAMARRIGPHALARPSLIAQTVVRMASWRSSREPMLSARPRASMTVRYSSQVA